MKRKVIAIALLLCVLAVTVTGTTIAYFTDSKTQTNVFTAGEVKILFTENGVEMTEPTVRIDHGRIYPGMTVTKNSTVKVVGGDAAYVAFRLLITDGEQDLRRVLDVPQQIAESGKHSVTELFAGTMLEGLTAVAGRAGYYENAAYLVHFDTSVTEGFLITAYAKSAVQTDGSLTFLDAICFPAAWDHTELSECRQLEIELQVYATQTSGFESCEQAMAYSFGDVF